MEWSVECSHGIKRGREKAGKERWREGEGREKAINNTHVDWSLLVVLLVL